MRPLVVLAFLVAAVSGASLVRIESGSSSYSAPALQPMPAPAPAFTELRTDSYSSNYGSPSLLVKNIPIVSMSHDIRGSLSDSLSYQTGNGISVSDNTEAVQGRGGLYADEYGKMVQSDQMIKKSGSYSFTTPEGKAISATWTADENGFRVLGDHLPQPVPMPADHAAAHTEALGRTRLSSSYETPLLVRSGYEAPAIVRSSYEAPAVLIRSSY